MVIRPGDIERERQQEWEKENKKERERIANKKKYDASPIGQKKIQYNTLLKRLINGINYFASINISIDVKEKYFSKWVDINQNMNKLLKEIGERPSGGRLKYFD